MSFTALASVRSHLLQILCGWIGLFFWQTAPAQIRLPHLISDGMVLQRDQPITVWGWAKPNEKVTILFNNQTIAITTQSDGKWTTHLSAMKAGGPYQMQIRASNQLTLNNIMVGDVWICSGQSNMVLPMERVKERYKEVIEQANNPAIRQFALPVRYNFQGPVDDVPPGHWESVTPQNVMRFSAVAYFFAKDLYEKYHVPIGLITASVGGSPAEAWLSAEALKAFPSQLAIANEVKDTAYINNIQRQEQLATRSWYRQLRQLDKGWQGDKNWADLGVDDSAWPTMHVPGFWEDIGVPPGNGAVWFRKEVDVPASMTHQPAKLFLGRIVDADSVFMNGRFVGTIGYQYPPRRYDLPADLLQTGKNTLVVRVISTNGKGGFIPDKRYELIVGGQTIDLKGGWRYQVGATTGPMPGTTFFQYKPGGLFNGMVAALLQYAIKGVIWYQGEANVGKAQEYSQLFPTLITDWRQKWKQTGASSRDFPFLYVQLANYLPTQEQPSESEWAELRDAQRRTLSVPQTAMVVATDVGEWNDIHPLNKQTVGKRLALAAEKMAYGDSRVVSSGPLYQSMKRRGHKLILTFTYTGSGLIAKGEGKLNQFAIAGADKKFTWATAKLRGNQVIVWSDQVPDPVTVRYAWADNPAGANLYNREGLPASPFTTEP